MRVLLQKVSEGKVTVADKTIGEIQRGFLLYVGFQTEDTIKDVEKLANKVSKLRVFEDENDKMNLSLTDVKGEILSISQFTLYGETKKGNRPSFTNTMLPETADKLYEAFNELLREKGFKVATGEFGAHMKVTSLNDGPVTFMLES